jgi:phosphatidylinositol 3,5-bisphosphate 5-phosphatase
MLFCYIHTAQTGPINKHKELLTSIRRYYSNAFTDRVKQDAMNLFLGYFIPWEHDVLLW